jgi:hypothetical protein
LKEVRGLYRRSGITPCPEEIILKKMSRFIYSKTEYKDNTIFEIVNSFTIIFKNGISRVGG